MNTTQLNLKAQWVFDYDDTHNLKIGKISIAEIQYIKHFGARFSATIGQKTACSDNLTPAREFKTLTAAIQWVEKTLMAEVIL
jgi:hypothetical protein